MLSMDVRVCQGCVTLMQVVEQLRTEVAQLRAELAAAKKNSSNSSKPPSSDIVKKPKDEPKHGSKRKRGGQPNHPRHERPAFADDQVDYTELHCSECPDCGGPGVPSKAGPKILQRIHPVHPTEINTVVCFCAHPCWGAQYHQVHLTPT